MSGDLPLALRLYRGASHVLAPVMPLFLRRRLARGKEDGARLNERLGKPARPRPDGPLIWLHAASVGETMSILPLITRLSAHVPVMLTNGTVTSAKLAAQRLPANAFHQFVPVDIPGAVEGFLDHWRPDLGMFCESELWPNLIMAAHQRAIRLGIVNGRMSARSYRKWSKAKYSAAALLAPLAFCLAQSDEDAARYRALGAPATSPGNLKFDVPALPVDEAKAEALRAAIGTRPVLVAASTHSGEEEIVLAAATALRREYPDLLTLIVPRHPERGEALEALVRAAGLPFARRSLGAMPGAGDAVYIADTLGELGLFYALASLAFIGGSLVEHGGHNPIEAIKFAKPVLSGPHVKNFETMFAGLQAMDGVCMVESAEALAMQASHLLRDASARQSLIDGASRFIARHEGALERSLAVILPFLPQGRG